jgi:hypothetical protein
VAKAGCLSLGVIPFVAGSNARTGALQLGVLQLLLRVQAVRVEIDNHATPLIFSNVPRSRPITSPRILLFVFTGVPRGKRSFPPRKQEKNVVMQIHGRGENSKAQILRGCVCIKNDHFFSPSFPLTKLPSLANFVSLQKKEKQKQEKRETAYATSPLRIG